MGNIYFSDSGDQKTVLSNFYHGPIFLEDTTWKTVTHFYHGQKFLNDYCIEICMANSPEEAVERAKLRVDLVRDDWEEIKLNVMRQGVERKFEMYPDAREYLISTGTSNLIYQTRDDCFWGVNDEGDGDNALGKIIMDMRSKLSDPANPVAGKLLEPPWVKHPDIERGSIGWRMGHAEEYLRDWVIWYMGRSHEQKEAYQRDNPAQGEWEGFYSETGK